MPGLDNDNDDDPEPPRAPSVEPRGHSPMNVDEPNPELQAIVEEINEFIAQHVPDLDLAGEQQNPPNDDAPPPPDPEFGYSEDIGVPLRARRQEVREALECIRDIRNATLSTSGLDEDTVDRLRHPPRGVPPLTGFERAGMRMFLARGDGSEDNYEDNRAAIVELHNQDEIPSYDQIKHRIANITGISTIRTAMCVNSCIAFTGPFADLNDCPTCVQPRYDPWHLTRGDKIPRRTFETFPVGPQIQAMYASPENARLMRHRAQRTQEIRDALDADPASLVDIDDIYCGKDYIREVKAGRIKNDDTVLMISLDGAQLYANKSSDCWFIIWVLYDLPPGTFPIVQALIPYLPNLFRCSLQEAIRIAGRRHWRPQQAEERRLFSPPVSRPSLRPPERRSADLGRRSASAIPLKPVPPPGDCRRPGDGLPERPRRASRCLRMPSLLRLPRAA